MGFLLQMYQSEIEKGEEDQEDEYAKQEKQKREKTCYFLNLKLCLQFYCNLLYSVTSWNKKLTRTTLIYSPQCHTYLVTTWNKRGTSTTHPVPLEQEYISPVLKKELQ